MVVLVFFEAQYTVTIYEWLLNYIKNIGVNEYSLSSDEVAKVEEDMLERQDLLRRKCEMYGRKWMNISFYPYKRRLR